MTLTIFCPSSHLILDAQRCPVCGWERPPAGKAGAIAWGPLSLDAELGGPGRGVLALPAVSQGSVAFALAGGSLVGLNLRSGQPCWRARLDAGRSTNSLVADGERFLASISDQRAIDQAVSGWLASIDPLTGDMSRLWDAGGHQLSDPVLAQELILVRTSSHGLVALRRTEHPALVWEQPLQAYWVLPPIVSDGRVWVSDGHPMQGEGMLRAFSLADGQPLWQHPTEGLVGSPPVVVEEVVIFRNGRRRVAALRVSDGELLWSQNYEHTYGTLCGSEKTVILAVRGPAPSGAAGHYELQALDINSGKPQWKAPLPAGARPRSGPRLHSGSLLIGCDDGSLLGVSASDGGLLWQTRLGSQEEPIRTELLVAEGLLLAGTYSGRVVAIHVGSDHLAPPDPQEALQCGDIQAAADAFALRGDLTQAARLYAEALHEPLKAIALYALGHHFQEAGDLASQQSLLPQALEYYQQAGNWLAEADILDQMGDHLGAGRKYEQAEAWIKAAQAYQAAHELRPALEIYRRLGDWDQIRRLEALVESTPEDVDRLEKEGRLSEAAEMALKMGAFRRAVDLFQRNKQPEREFEALRRLGQAENEPFAWQRLAELARSLGRFLQEAEAWEALKKPREAAEAYHRAARQAELAPAKDEKETARLFEKAEKYYDDIGQLDKVNECHLKVVQYACLPEIEVLGQAREAFEQEEWNVLDLTVQNIGEGVARNIRVRVVEDVNFEPDRSKGTEFLRSLGVKLAYPIEIHVRPKPDVFGRRVPLKIEWYWTDEHGQKEHREQTTSVQVKRRDDSSHGATPPIINIAKYVQGDEIAGDQLREGAQKGDKVEIRRDGRPHAYTDSLPVEQPGRDRSAQPTCPVCSLPIPDPSAQFCQECGAPLPKKGRGKRTV